MRISIILSLDIVSRAMAIHEPPSASGLSTVNEHRAKLEAVREHAAAHCLKARAHRTPTRLHDNRPRDTDVANHILLPPAPSATGNIIENLDPALLALHSDASQGDDGLPRSLIPASPSFSLGPAVTSPGHPWHRIYELIDSIGVQPLNSPAAQELEEAISQNERGLVSILESKLISLNDELKVSRQATEVLQTQLENQIHSHKRQIRHMELRIAELSQLQAHGFESLSAVEMDGAGERELITDVEKYPVLPRLTPSQPTLAAIINSPAVPSSNLGSPTNSPAPTPGIPVTMPGTSAGTPGAAIGCSDAAMLEGVASSSPISFTSPSTRGVPAPASGPLPSADVPTIHEATVRCPKCKCTTKVGNLSSHMAERCKALFKAGQVSKFWIYVED